MVLKLSVAYIVLLLLTVMSSWSAHAAIMRRGSLKKANAVNANNKRHQHLMGTEHKDQRLMRAMRRNDKSWGFRSRIELSTKGSRRNSTHSSIQEFVKPNARIVNELSESDSNGETARRGLAGEQNVAESKAERAAAELNREAAYERKRVLDAEHAFRERAEANSTKLRRETATAAADVRQVRAEDDDTLESRNGNCKRFGWPVRENRQAKIFYGVVTNGEDLPLLEAHIRQVYDFVHRFVVVEARVTHTGSDNPYPAIDFTSESFKRFAPKLRNVTYTEAIFKDRFLRECEVERPLVRELGGRVDKHACTSWARQNGQRKLIAEGFKDLATGVTELSEEDVVMVADLDEVPTRDAMRALSECEPPQFSAAKHDFRSGQKPCEEGKQNKVLFKSQYVYFYVDCPITHLWWHPDAVSAVCLLHGGWSTYDVRMGMSGTMTEPVASFHLHNVGRTDKQLEFKYKTYGEPCQESDAVCHPGHMPEMRKRVCDNATTPLGPDNWSFKERALNDLVDGTRGWHNGETAASFKSFLTIVAEKPQQFAHFFWAS
jgi:hypothetical protein